MTETKKKSMTDGPLVPRIIQFILPLMLTGILQLLYNMADSIIVGRWEGSNALAAVSSVGSLINLILNVFMGLAVGASVAVAHDYGAKDYNGVERIVHTSMLLSVIGGLAVGAVGMFFARTFLIWMDSPADVLPLSTVYLRIYFAGTPANMAYNFGASVLRSVGDTKRPLYFLTISGIVNVVLNLILVAVFHMGVAGVAIATIASQYLSAVFVIVHMLRTDECIRLDLRKLRFHKDKMVKIVTVGLPAGFQGAVFSISNVLIQSSVNSFGSIAMAGNSAASNIEGFVYTSMNALHQADLTFASQNLGARQFGRVRRAMWVCLGVVTAIGLGMGLTFYAIGPTLISFYNTDPEVIRYGMLRLSIILPTYFLCGTMDVMVGQLRGIGYSIMPMIVSLTGACLLRVVWIFTIFAANPTLNTLYISYPISWFATFATHLICYLTLGLRRLRRLEEGTPGAPPLDPA